MVSQRHVPFAVYRQAVGGVGDAGLHRYNIKDGDDNGQVGLGVPAKSIAITNHGPGILYYQISPNGSDISVTDGIDSGQGKIFSPDESIYVSVISVYSDNAATIFSILATPGKWDEDELNEVLGG